MNYTEQISLEQALDLQNRINAGEMPDIHCYVLDYKGGASNPNHLSTWILGAVYDVNKHSIYLTRSDYATFIIGNKPVPEGYGYASMELDSGIYDSLGGLVYTNFKSWVAGSNFQSDGTDLWHDYAFLLTDLARVEAEPVVAEMERTEINEAQVEYIVKHDVKTKLFYQCGDEVVEQIRFWINDIEAAKNGTVFSLLTTDYNSLPDEFKALAEPKPSMPAHFEPDWKAKYIELEEQHNTLIKHLQEATASADAKQDIINNLEDKNKKLKFRLDDLHGYSPKDLKIAELEMQVDFNKDMRKMHLENVSNLHDFYHKIIWNLFGQLEK